MDPLSQAMRAVDLAGAIFIHGRFSAPWCYQSPHADSAAAVLEPGADRVVIFHLVTEGECWVEMDGQDPLHCVAGDVLLFPQGDAHRMSSEPGVAPAGGSRQLAEVLAMRPRFLRYGGGGAATQLVCGYLACNDRVARLLLEGLPALVKVNVRGSDTGRWLETSVGYALSQARTPQPGSEGVLAKLSEMLFFEVLRLFMNERSASGIGWLAGAGDRIVGAALNALHQHPAHDWTLEALARASGTSRSVLAERFQQLVGSPPMQYLTQWRMQLAAKLLTRSDAPLARIAEDVGYQTDTAFSRAFRREYGAPPAQWRRRQQTARLALA